jgi:Domain of unknown function (DUF4340)
MKIRSLFLATLVLLALVGTLYWSDHRKPTDDTKVSADTAPPILKLDEGSITRLELKKKDAPSIVLAKNSSGAWHITEPKPINADQSTVSSALSTLASLNSERVVDDKASDLKQYGLDRPALEVDISEKNNHAQRLLIGDETPAGSAVYAMLAGDPRVFTVASYHKTSIDKNLNDLRDKRLLTISADKVSRFDLIRKNQEIEFGRNRDEWQILKPKPLRADSGQVGELLGKLADARMDLSLPTADNKDAASDFAQGAPLATAKLTDQAGTQELQVRKNKDTYYAKSSIVDGAYKLDSSLGQALDKGLDDFRNKKLFDFGYSEPGKIELHNGSKADFLTKGGPDWWSNGKKMDSGSVQDLISQLRELSASKFVDSGFANPAIEITVTSDEGKRVEKVSIAKSASGYIAKRENESSMYQMDASAIDRLQKAVDDVKPAAAPSK